MAKYFEKISKFLCQCTFICEFFTNTSWSPLQSPLGGGWQFIVVMKCFMIGRSDKWYYDISKQLSHWQAVAGLLKVLRWMYQIFLLKCTRFEAKSSKFKIMYKQPFNTGKTPFFIHKIHSWWHTICTNSSIRTENRCHSKVCWIVCIHSF